MIPASPVLYAVICGVSNAASSYDFIADTINDGWRVCVITTPMGARFVDLPHLADLTGHPVRSAYKNPADPDVLPRADACVVAPASFNTVNKLANGICDTLAVGVVCEAIGDHKPIIVAPWVNRALAGHGAYARSIACLRDEGVCVVLTEQTRPDRSRTAPGGSFPWADVLAEVRGLPATRAGGIIR
ncbi:flavoprotein [Actinoplanes sp. NPDC049668]|uniref:flavoprotein n=1 Tax=unclassified Actinoplanes TaxID=2626549 RepID=UPI0033BF4DDB